MRNLFARMAGMVRRLIGKPKTPPVPEEDLQRYLDDGGGVVEDPTEEGESDR